MEIRQFRVVLRARNFDRTARFYAETLALPRIKNWDHQLGRGARFAAGGGYIEVVGRPRREEQTGRDEDFDYQGPDHKLTITVIVPSAETAYEELIFRDKNIPGGLRQSRSGDLIFETRDPDGVKIVFQDG
ncbi:MAG: VOC family protein [Thermoanaerobaculia bacterium]